MADSRNTVSHAGQVNIISCDILQAGGDGINVLPLVEKITVFEDIFSPFISGELVLRDTYDVPNALGRASRDLLKIEIETPSLTSADKLKGFFLIYKMTNRQLASDRSQLYTYHFVSEEMIYDIQRKVSKTFKGTGNTIVEQLIKSRLASSKTLTSDAPSNSLHYTSNFWSPTKNIRFIIENSTDGNADFLFYENRDGFNFKSLSKIATSEDLMQKFVASDFVAQVEDGNPNSIRFGAASRDPNMDYRIIREMRVDSSFDFLDFIQSGGGRTKLMTHDLLKKKYEVKQFSLANESHGQLNENKFLDNDVISNLEPLMMTASKNYNANGKGDVTNTKFLQKRVSQMAQFQSFKIEIDVFGRSDYTVGKKVYLDINQTRKITKEEQRDSYLDKVYSGFYIVARVAHHVTRKEHMTTLELIKDSTLLK